MKLVSTTALAKEKEIDTKELFAQLKANGWIYKKDDKWHLTQDGRVAGGDTKYNPKFGEYVVWPLNLKIDAKVDAKTLLSATKISDLVGVSNKKINLYLSDLGWSEKDRGGWSLTKAGKKNGGHQLEASNGKPYCLWDESIVNNKHFVRTLEIGEGKSEVGSEKKEEKTEWETDFRKKFPAEYRTSDGHYVRSRAEALIDNYFYNNGVVHAYEKKLNIDEPMYCDFYLPEGKIYIEFWGLEEDAKYSARKKQKLDLYSKYNFKLLELNNADLDNLDEVLETKLRKMGVVIH